MKIISIAVIMCFLITSLAYPDTIPKKYCLRPQLDFNNQKRATVIARYNQASRYYVEYKAHLREKAMRLIISLRPEIKEGENLTAQEFEKHIRTLAEKLNDPYLRVGRVGFFNFFGLIKDDFSLSLFVGIIELLTFIVIPRTYSYGYYIRIPGKTAFILPLIGTIAVRWLLPYPFNIFWIVYFFSFIFNIWTGYKTNNASIRHELKHVYGFLILKKLHKERLLDLHIGEADALLPSDHGEDNRYTERINIRELEKIENTIINSLFPEPELDHYKDGLPKSDIPADTESENRVREIRVLYEQL